MPQCLNLHAKTASSTVRTSFNRVFGPIRCAESNGVVRLAVRALVLEIWWKTCPISRFLKHPSTDSFIYSQNILRDGRYTYLTRRFQYRCPFGCTGPGCGGIVNNVSDLAIF